MTLYMMEASKVGYAKTIDCRTFHMTEHQADVLQFAIPPYSEEYFNAIHDHAVGLMQKKEFEKSLLVLYEVHDFIRKTDQTSHLAHNLILQAVVHLVSHYESRLYYETCI